MCSLSRAKVLRSKLTAPASRAAICTWALLCVADPRSFITSVRTVGEVMLNDGKIILENLKHNLKKKVYKFFQPIFSAQLKSWHMLYFNVSSVLSSYFFKTRIYASTNPKTSEILCTKWKMWRTFQAKTWVHRDRRIEV